MSETSGLTPGGDSVLREKEEDTVTAEYPPTKNTGKRISQRKSSAL